ncbi:hypothetical protein V5O48_015307 [Marasmius crinis-equi]|uniref:Uncharacterized protein n=1 Tax=Marasmius crinis-equi TaxID=585013 RepID=A0ABR3EV78_9AGAR
MTRLGIDVAAVAAAARNQRHHYRQPPHPDTLNLGTSPDYSSHPHPHRTGMMTDVENISSSPVATTTHGQGPQRLTSNTSNPVPERPLSRVDEEAVDIDDERSISTSSESELEMEIEEEGFYVGSYPNLIATYTLAPLTFLVFFALFASIPPLFFPIPSSDCNTHPYPYAPYLPFPTAEILISGGIYTITHILNVPIFKLSRFLFPEHVPTALPIVLSSLSYATISVLMRLSTIPLLLLGGQEGQEGRATWRDPIFRRVWWAGLGWALFEAVAGVWQGYRALEAYKDVLVDVRKLKSRAEGGEDGGVSRGEARGGRGVKGYGATSTSVERDGDGDGDESPTTPRPADGGSGFRSASSSTAIQEPTSPRGRLPRVPSDPERQPLLSHSHTHAHAHTFSLSHSRESTSLGQALAMSLDTLPFPQEEVERDLDQLMALRERDGLERVYGVAYIKIPIFISCLQRVNSLLLSMGLTLILASLPTSTSSDASSTPKLILPLLILIQTLLYILHSELALPKIGVHTVVYVGFMVSLGMVFVGLGVWDAVS